MKKYYCSIITCCLTSILFAQTDTASKKEYPSIFARITKSVKEYKLDTSNAPDDKMTKKIIELRALRGGFNINEVIVFKLEEDLEKKDITKQDYDKLSAFFKTGNGKKWLDNSAIWIYRQNFTYPELKRLVRFYKTDAGQKMADNLPILMVQTLAAAQMIKDSLGQQKK